MVYEAAAPPWARRGPRDASGSDALRAILGAARRIATARSRHEIATEIVATVRETLAFDAVAVNLVERDGDLSIAAADGPAQVETLRGGIVPRAAVDALLVASEPWGSLRFVEHAAGREAREASPLVDDAWQPGDVLLAPLRAPGGELLGVVSVDRPLDGLLPSPERCVMLEIVAADAAGALHRLARSADDASSSAAYREAFERVPVGLAVLDATFSLVTVNDAFAHTVGATAGDLVGVALADLLDDADAYELLEACRAACARPGATAAVEHRFASHGGPSRWARSSVSAVRGDGSGADSDQRIVLTSCDVTEARRTRAEQGARAARDTLTGLGNRRAALARLEHALARRRDNELVALVVVDVDDLAGVNDAHGRNAGDAVLVHAAEMLASMLRSGEDLYRIGGDELAVVCEHLRDRRSAEALAGRLASVRPTASGVRGQVSCTLRAGVAAAAADASSPSSTAELVAAAYDALDHGRRSSYGARSRAGDGERRAGPRR